MKRKILITIMLLTLVMANSFKSLAQSKWMSKLPDETRICDLSIPCAHDAATHSVEGDFWQDQEYDERTLFDMGVRCFDMRISEDDCYNHGENGNWHNFFSGNDLNDYDDEQANHMPTLQQLGNSETGEFMIPEVQWEGPESTEKRKAGFNRWLKMIMTDKTNPYPKDRFVKFKKGMTLGDVRGKILVIANYKDGFEYACITDNNYKIPITLARDGWIFDSENGASAEYAPAESKDPYCARSRLYDVCQVEKKADIAKGINDWATYYENHDNNSLGQWNHISVNSWYYVSIVNFVTASGICADDDDGEVIGTNHFTYSCLENLHIPYGIVQFDFIGEKTHDFDNCYGDKLLNRIVENNFKTVLFEKYICDLKTFDKNDHIETMTEQGYTGCVYLNSCYLAYKRTNNLNEAITNMLVVADTEAHTQIEGPDGQIYYPVPDNNVSCADISYRTGNGTGNCNHYLYYTKASDENKRAYRPVTGLEMVGTKTNDNEYAIVDLRAQDGLEDKAPFNFNIYSGGQLYLQLYYHNHTFVQRSTETHHYDYCSYCGLEKNKVAHSFSISQHTGNVHEKSCSDCDYTEFIRCASSAYNTNSIGTCSVCGATCYEKPEWSAEKEAYMISNAGQLLWYEEEVNYACFAQKVVLTKDIDLSPLFPNCEENENSHHWMPIAYYGVPVFFDGCGHVISGLAFHMLCNRTLPNEYDPFFGLFGRVRGGYIKNVGLVNSSFKAASYYRMGSIATELIGCKMSNVYSNADMQNPNIQDPYKNVGSGLVYYLSNNSEVSNCYYTGNCSNVVKQIQNSTLTNCYAKVADSHKDKITILTEENMKKCEFINWLNANVEAHNQENPGDWVRWQQKLGTDDTPTFGSKGIYYQRNMSNQWGTLLLPYKVQSDDAIQYYKIKSSNIISDTEGTITLEEVSEVEAHTPCIFKRLTADETLTFANKGGYSYAESVTPVTTGSTTLNGTYDKLTNQTGIYYIAQNKFWYAEDAITVPAYRAWLTYNSGSNANVRSISILVEEDGETTQIGEIRDGEFNMFDGKYLEDGRIVIKRNNKKYNLNGQEIK